MKRIISFATICTLTLAVMGSPVNIPPLSPVIQSEASDLNDMEKAFKGYFYREDTTEKAKEAIEEAAANFEYITPIRINHIDAEVDGDTATTSKTTTNNSSTETGGYSNTNLRELGVDEGDIIKTDGKYIYVLSDNNDIRIIKASGAKMTLAAKISPEYEDTADYQLREMYVRDDKLILVSDTYTVKFYNELLLPTETVKSDAATSSVISGESIAIKDEDKTTVSIYDISDRNNPVKTGEFSSMGHYKTSRISNGFIYLFTWYNNGDIPVICGQLPSADNIYLPKNKLFFRAFTMASVSLDSLNTAVDSKVIYTTCDDVYVTQDSVILEVNDYTYDGERTKLFKFETQNGLFNPVGVGAIPGYLESSFSIDQDNKGRIRATSTNWNSGKPSSGVFVFDKQMKRIGKLTGIAKGEEIQSARFMDDILYLVTYENKDPLFSIDLSHPANPKIIGKLDIPGFSDYLHFWGDKYLLGIGYDSNEKNGEILGAKLSLFNISKPKKVKEVATKIVKGIDDIEGMYNYKALLVDPKKNMIGFNTCDWDKKTGSTYKQVNKYYVFSVNKKHTKFKNKASLKTFNGWDDTRGIYIGNTFYLLSGNKLRSYNMNKNFKLVNTVKFK
ncbi:MAG: beta-propeller domain-containing protein [Lachnospiraceae bacterium]|nr:beta-propeller domain-containing protein [Lachnospiraceae bacterium]